MAAPSVWHTRSGGSDDILRPSREFWRDLARVQRSDPDTERSIHEYGMADEMDGYNSARRMPLREKWLPKSHTDKPPRPNMTVEQEIAHSVLFQDE